MSLWITNHAAITHPPRVNAITCHPPQPRVPAKSNHETNHADHAPRAITPAPLFSKGAGVLSPPTKGPSMNPSYDQLLAILGEIDYRALADDIRLDMPGARAASLEPGRGGGDPTDNHATRDQRQAFDDHATIEAAIVRAYTAAMVVRAIQARRLPGREAGRTEPPAQPKACKLHMLATGQVHEVWRTSDMANHLATPFTEPTPLCEPCFDAIRYYGAVPDKASIIHYERTGRWGLKAAKRNPKAA